MNTKKYQVVSKGDPPKIMPHNRGKIRLMSGNFMQTYCHQH